MDSIPEALRPLVRRLESVPDLSRKDLISLLFVVRLGDSLHKNFYGTSLTLSLVGKLCDKLGIPDLQVEIEVFSMRWSFRQGTVSVVHRILWDYDMDSVASLTKIARGVLNDTITPKEGLRLIRDVEVRTNYCSLESCYRDFPGRALVLPLMAGTVATVFFNGTWYDLGFATVAGVVAGLVAWIGDAFNQLFGIVDYTVAIFVAMIATGVVTSFPDNACYSAQVLGTLYWFLYGTAYVLSLYEITNNQLVTGATRFIQAILRTYGLAFGAMIGTWLVAFAGPSTVDAVLAECTTKGSQIDDLWFILLFPLSGIACLMQFRVGLNHFPICLLIQTIAYGSQYVIGTVWNQPEFLANMIPAYLATLASHVCIVIVHRYRLSALEVDRHAYIRKKKTDEWDVDSAVNEEQRKGHHQRNGSIDVEEAAEDLDSSAITFINTGWVQNAMGYIQDDEVLYARSDLWFCLLPALYLLVPGAKVLQSTFMHLIVATFGDGDYSDVNDLLSSILVIGLGQVVGLRLAFATLYVLNSLWAWMDDRNRAVRASCKGEDVEQSVIIHERGDLPAISNGTNTDGNFDGGSRDNPRNQ